MARRYEPFTVDVLIALAALGRRREEEAREESVCEVATDEAREVQVKYKA